MKIYYLTIYDLQTCHQNFLDILLCQGSIGILQTFVDGDVVRHLIDAAIDATYRFFESINIPMHLREVGIDDSRINEMAHHIAVNEGLENAYAPLTEQDIKEILVASL